MFDPTSISGYRPVYGEPIAVTGFRLVDSRASYGIGLETFALGFPIHFDWSWRTLFNKDYEDALFAAQAAATGSVARSSTSGSGTISRMALSSQLSAVSFEPPRQGEEG